MEVVYDMAQYDAESLEIRMLSFVSNAVVLWSGGLDSTALVAWLIEKRIRVYPLFIDRGQRSLAGEWHSVMDYVNHLSDVYELDLYVEQHPLRNNYYHLKKYSKDPRKTHALRNSDLANMGVRYALCRGADAVYLGSVVGDDTYGDGTMEYWRAKQNEVRIGTNGKILYVESPFRSMGWDKTTMLQWAQTVDLDLTHTWSCYMPGEVQCGKCKSCLGRRMAFQKAGIKDTAEYRSDLK